MGNFTDIIEMTKGEFYWHLFAAFFSGLFFGAVTIAIEALKHIKAAENGNPD